jgi:uncharacterized protein (DUF983 family)
MSDNANEPGNAGNMPSPFVAGIKCRCPRCGEGHLFRGYLTLATRCESCGLEYNFADSGDGPAVFIILFVGFVVVGLALLVDVLFAPPLWVHLVLWVPTIFGLCLGLLRPFKATMIALQFHHDARQGRTE